MADVFRGLFRRPGNSVPRAQAQRFVLQTVVAMFAEDIDLLPAGTIQTLATDCLERDQNAFDLFGGLFRQMNSPVPAAGGRFQRAFDTSMAACSVPSSLWTYAVPNWN